jgi:hypothetical protein
MCQQTALPDRVVTDTLVRGWPHATFGQVFDRSFDDQGFGRGSFSFSMCSMKLLGRPVRPSLSAPIKVCGYNRCDGIWYLAVH